MPKYDVTFKVEYVMEVEAETTALAEVAARDILRDIHDLGGPWSISKIIRTDPPLSTETLIEAGEKPVDQPDTSMILELPRAPRPVDCSTPGRV